MTKRWIITINESLCDGCGICSKGCPEGAIQIIDGKAVLIAESFCDGLGACLDDCPRMAIGREQREAEPYSETGVMENIVRKGTNVIKAHLKHLKDHDQTEWYAEAVKFLKDKNMKIPEDNDIPMFKPVCNCGSEGMNRTDLEIQWPIQLGLISPQSKFLKGNSLRIVANCVPFVTDMKWRGEKVLATACPKFDSDVEGYPARIKDLIDIGGITDIELLIMDIPCCKGLKTVTEMGAELAEKHVNVTHRIINRH